MNRIEEFIIHSLTDYSRPSRSRDMAVDLHTAFDAFFEVDLSGEHKVEVPACLTGFALAGIENKYNSIVMPITAPSTAQPRRLIRGILSDFMNPNASRRTGFAYCKTTAGDYYYGVPGIILDGDKKPLLVITLEINYKQNPSSREGVLDYTPIRCICHVSPNVFANSDKLVEKTIIKKIIPFCSTKVIERGDIYRNLAYSDSRPFILGTTIKVVIDDCSNFTVKPIPPNPSVNTNQVLNELVKNNISSITDYDNTRVL